MGADHRLVEMNKAVYEFDRDIIRGAVNAVRFGGSLLSDHSLSSSAQSCLQRTGTIQGEKVLKYFEDYKRSRVSCVGNNKIKDRGTPS